jgi:hypothetical protein
VWWLWVEAERVLIRHELLVSVEPRVCAGPRGSSHGRLDCYRDRPGSDDLLMINCKPAVVLSFLEDAHTPFQEIFPKKRKEQSSK